MYNKNIGKNEIGIRTKDIIPNLHFFKVLAKVNGNIKKKALNGLTYIYTLVLRSLKAYNLTT